MSKNVKILLSILGGLLLLGYLNKKKIMETYNDLISLQRIKKLHPSIRDKVRGFLNTAKKMGINLRVTSTLRTMEEQQNLYNKGRTEPGKIVTNARPGQSKHNYGVAFDVVIMDNGNPVWNYNDPRWQKVGKLGKEYGFLWGGDFNSIKDLPHFELPLSIAQLQNLEQQRIANNKKYINLA